MRSSILYKPALILVQVLFPILTMGFHSISVFSRRYICSRCHHFATISNTAAETKRRKNEQLMEASKLSLAPMMEYTDRHFRHLVRLISSKTLLYSEMVAANALSHERNAQLQEVMEKNPGSTLDQAKHSYDDKYLQRFLCQGHVPPLEGASVLQLGGSSPGQMKEAAQTVMDLTSRGHCDYTAINLNCGCPSPKVAGKGCFGAALMDDAKLVSDLTRALDEGCGGQLPITVKCRIGTDSNFRFSKDAYAQRDGELEYRQLCDFVETVASNGIVTDFSVHARIAVLSKTFSPADNRKIPPLKYEVVNRLVEDYPEFTFSLNGGVDSIPQAQAALETCPGLNGVMIGRSWAADPWSFAMADQQLYNVQCAPRNRLEILKDYGKHADAEEELWDPLKIRRLVVKAVTTLFTGEPNAKRYRIALDQIARMPKILHAQGKTLAGQPPLSELILNAAYEHLSEDVLLRTPEESYEQVLLKVEKNHLALGDRSEAVAEWHYERRKEP